jgi:hypothetical protein
VQPPGPIETTVAQGSSKQPPGATKTVADAGKSPVQPAKAVVPVTPEFFHIFQ